MYIDVMSPLPLGRTDVSTARSPPPVLRSDPSGTFINLPILDVKRLLGWSWNDACVKRFCENSAFTMVDVGGKPVIEVTHNGQVCF